MNQLQFFVGLFLITLFAACTTQVQPNLPEPETTTITTIDDNDEVTLRSTQQECDDYYDTYIFPGGYTGPEFAEYVECRLNQGIDESDVMSNCTLSEQYTNTTCIDRNDFETDYTTTVTRLKTEVAQNTNDCPGCDVSSAAWGCRIIIFSVVYLNDDQCPNAPDEWEFEYRAEVYCCD